MRKIKAHDDQFPTTRSAREQAPATLSIRARLLMLALIAVVPLMIDRARSIDTDRDERIAALSEEALALTRQGIEAQKEIVVADQIGRAGGGACACDARHSPGQLRPLPRRRDVGRTLDHRAFDRRRERAGDLLDGRQ